MQTPFGLNGRSPSRFVSRCFLRSFPRCVTRRLGVWGWFRAVETPSTSFFCALTLFSRHRSWHLSFAVFVVKDSTGFVFFCERGFPFVSQFPNPQPPGLIFFPVPYDVIRRFCFFCLLNFVYSYWWLRPGGNCLLPASLL